MYCMSCYKINKVSLDEMYERALLMAKDGEHFLELITYLFTDRQETNPYGGYATRQERKQAYKVFRGIFDDAKSLKRGLKKGDPIRETIYYYILDIRKAIHEMVLEIGKLHHKNYNRSPSSGDISKIREKIRNIITTSRDAMRYIK